MEQAKKYVPDAKITASGNTETARGICENCGGSGYIDRDGVMVRCPACEKRRRLERLVFHLRRAGIPDGALRAALKGEPANKDQRRFWKVRGVSKKRNLIMAGAPGCGKTTAAVRLLAIAIDEGSTVAFANLERLALEVRAGYDGKADMTEERAVRMLSDPDVIVLDDLGGEGEGRIEKRILYHVLDIRAQNGRTTIITTNVEPADLVRIYGRRTLDRLNPYTLARFKGGSLRKGQQRDGW